MEDYIIWGTTTMKEYKREVAIKTCGLSMDCLATCDHSKEITAYKLDKDDLTTITICNSRESCDQQSQLLPIIFP